MEAKTAKTSLDVQWTMQSLQQSGGMPHCPIQQLILYFLPFDPFPLQAHIEYRGHLKKKRASQCCTDQWEVYADANHHWRGLHTMLHIALWHFFLIILFLPGWILLHPRIPVHVELCSSISMTVWKKEIHGFTAQPTHFHLVTHWTNILSEYVDNGVVWHVLHSFPFTLYSCLIQTLFFSSTLAIVVVLTVVTLANVALSLRTLSQISLNFMTLFVITISTRVVSWTSVKIRPLPPAGTNLCILHI